MRHVREIARTIYRAHRDTWSVDQAIACADILMRDRHLETKGVAVELVARYRSRLTPRLLPNWKRWLADSRAGNWATTDAICGGLIGPLVLGHPKLARTVAGWSRNPNRWVRRASAVGLIPSLRQGVALDCGYAVASRLHGDRENLIQKAVGWMLREAGKADPVRLEHYLRARGPRIPRTRVRYAIERFDERKRRDLLAATKRVIPIRDRAGTG